MPALPEPPFLYPILDLSRLGARRPGDVAAELARAGVRLLQLRAKGLGDAELLAAAREATEAAHAAGALLVVNDRPDVARLAEADGVHLGQDDLPPRAARRALREGRLIGFSTHDLAQLEAAAAEPVDYLAFGPIFETRSKQAPDPVVGLAVLREAAARARKPLVAIGGITRANAREVVAAGARGLAVISDLLEADDLRAAVAAFDAAFADAAR